MIAEIVVDIAAKQVNRSFDYHVPTHLEHVIRIGSRVKVFFGNRVLVGFVIGLKKSSNFKKSLKDIVDMIDIFPVLNEEFVNLAKYMAKHYFTYYAVALQAMIPTALKIKYQKVAKLIHMTDALKPIFKTRKEIIVDHRPLEELAIIFDAYAHQQVVIDTKFKRVRRDKTVTYLYVLDELGKPSSKQGKALLEYLLELGEPVSKTVLMEDSGFSKSVIDTLVKNNILGFYQQELHPMEENVPVSDTTRVEMTPLQQECYLKLVYDEFKTYLLYGVTGSGKTLVYIHWIDTILKHQKQAILLVPEISLTPQITAIFKQHFGNDVAILHSRLTTYEKYEEWKKIINHEVNIVIGARSAIFAPLDHLGIIIIDEAHESSYIQDNNPRYNAIEIAQERGKTHQCPVVLGSATPDVKDYYMAVQGEYDLLTLPKRVQDRPLPKKTIVDMTLELKQGNRSVFSNLLKEKIISVYQKHQQSILFLNRRGHSSFVMCRNCGEVVKCPHCDVSLTYHAYGNLLKCHHCGFVRPNVSTCEACGSSKIRFVGSGTEKVMEELTKLIPEARILRLDMDTAHKMSDYEDAFKKFKNHEADILVGTQMIAKGLDFADVTLVGIINADLALHYPSYDANSTAFNLIQQVSGRAGRGDQEGEVIIQTYQPKHFVIQSALVDHYEQFFNQEIAYRKLTQMPPFSLAIEVMVSSKDAQLAYEEAKNVIIALKKVTNNSKILGPAEALPFKINDVFRFTIQIKIIEDAVYDRLQELVPIYQNNKNVDLKIKRM